MTKDRSLSPSASSVHRATLSIVILTFNNENIIADLLLSVAWADEVIVVDSGSADGTLDIVRAVGGRVRVLERKLDSFSSQRNFAADAATMQWVLHCDSDELVDDTLREEIEELLASDAAGKLETPAWNIKLSFRWFSCRLPFVDDFWGGGVKLYRRGVCRFVGDVHEYSDFAGKIGKLSSPITHWTRITFSESVVKYLHYGNRESRLNTIKNKKWAGSAFGVIFYPLRRFFGLLLVKQAYKSGIPGLLWIFLQSLSLYFAHLAYYLRVRNLGILWEGEGPLERGGGHRLLRK